MNYEHFLYELHGMVDNLLLLLTLFVASLWHKIRGCESETANELSTIKADRMICLVVPSKSNP